MYPEVVAKEEGKVENTFTETFNNVSEESNLVWNTVPGDPEPETPGEDTPGDKTLEEPPVSSDGFSAQTGGFGEDGLSPASIALVAGGVTLLLGSGGTFVVSRRRKGAAGE